MQGANDMGLVQRAYFATRIGPLRPPFGRARQVRLPLGAREILATNNTETRVVGVNIGFAPAAAPARFFKDGSGANPALQNVDGTNGTRFPFFTLLPGETLYAEPTVPNTVLDVFTEMY